MPLRRAADGRTWPGSFGLIQSSRGQKRSTSNGHCHDALSNFDFDHRLWLPLPLEIITGNLPAEMDVIMAPKVDDSSDQRQASHLAKQSRRYCHNSTANPDCPTTWPDVADGQRQSAIRHANGSLICIHKLRHMEKLSGLSRTRLGFSVRPKWKSMQILTSNQSRIAEGTKKAQRTNDPLRNTHPHSFLSTTTTSGNLDINLRNDKNLSNSSRRMS